jgi:hypothetical protein
MANFRLILPQFWGACVLASYTLVRNLHTIMAIVPFFAGEPYRFGTGCGTMLGWPCQAEILRHGGQAPTSCREGRVKDVVLLPLLAERVGSKVCVVTSTSTVRSYLL